MPAPRKRRHSQKDRALDLYQTAPEAVWALLRHETLPHTLWDASCGPGNIVRILRANGHDVLATDIKDYASPHQDLAGIEWDFLQLQQPPCMIEAIIQNPPYYVADEFVEHSLELVPKAYFLLRLAWLESMARLPFFKRGMLRRVLVFSNRLPMQHRDGWTGKRSSNTTAFAWFVFDREYRGLPEVRWIVWRESDNR
jgi:hypothetical protein